MSVKRKLDKMVRNNRSVLIHLIIVLFGASCGYLTQNTGNRQDRSKVSAEYESLVKAGNEAIGNREFQKAREQLMKARDLAEDEGWDNEVVNTISGIGESFAVERNAEKAEEQFKQAISYCEKSAKCKPDQMDVPVGFLMYVYLYQEKDAAKAEQLIDQISSLRVFSDIKKDRVCHYINEIRDAGFRADADRLAKKESCFY